MALALTACGEKKVDAPAASGTAATGSAANLPPECQAYFECMEKCFAKGGAQIESLKAGLEVSKNGLLIYRPIHRLGHVKWVTTNYQVAQAAKCEKE